MGGSCLKTPKLLEGFQQSSFIGKIGEGRVSCCKLLGVRSFALVAVHVGQVTMFKINVILVLQLFI